MNRRQYLGLAGTGIATATAGCTNSLTSSSGDSSALDLPDDATVYAINEKVTRDSVEVWVNGIEMRDEVEYNNPEEGSIKKWNPGESRMLVFVDFWARNLSDEKKTFPRWRAFKLLTPEETHDPIVETPDGTEVEEIESPHVSWVESNGISANYKRGWSAVYEVPKVDATDVAVKWAPPFGNPVFWS